MIALTTAFSESFGGPMNGRTCVLKSARNRAIHLAQQQPISKLSKEDNMKGHLARVLLCAALLSPAIAPGLAVAADKPNEFNKDMKHDLKYEGSITAIDSTAGTVTVKSKEKGPLTLTVSKDSLLFVKHKKGAAALTDFKVGEEVHVLYVQSGTTIVANSMWHPGANPSEKQ